MVLDVTSTTGKSCKKSILRLHCSLLLNTMKGNEIYRTCSIYVSKSYYNEALNYQNKTNLILMQSELI